MVDEHVYAFGKIAVSGHSSGGHFFIIEFIPIIINANLGIVVTAIQCSQMMDHSHQLVLYLFVCVSLVHFDVFIEFYLSIIFFIFVVALKEARKVKNEVAWNCVK